MIVAGIGLRAATTLATLAALLNRAEETTGQPIDALATATEKATHPALTALAQTRALPLHAVAIDGIAIQLSRVTLLEMDLEALMQDEAKLKQVQKALGPNASVSELKPYLKDVKGLKVNDPVVTIAFR